VNLCALCAEKEQKIWKTKIFPIHLPHQKKKMIKEEIKTIINREADAIRSIPVDESYEMAINLIHEHVHQKKGKLIISGMGKAGQIAMNIATTFSSTGTPAFFLHPSEAQHGDLGIMCTNDILLLISNSGKTRELVELVSLSKGLVQNVKYILITSNSNSPLAKAADVCMLTGSPEEICPLGLTPTTSTTAMTVIGDVLVVSVMKKIGFTSADYAKRHHGGYLGEKSREQSE
jgi:arabinose-5-phosphate isomerase